MYRLVLLDFDNVLADNSRFDYLSFKTALAGKRFASFKAFCSLRKKGLTAKQILKPYCGSRKELAALLKTRREIYISKLPIDYITPYGFSRKALVLARKKGLKLAVISLREPARLKSLIKKFGWTGFFDKVYCRKTREKNASGLSLEKKRFVKKALVEFKTAKNRAVFIGDQPSDLAAAKKAGVDGIGVSTGYFSDKTLSKEKPVKVFKNVYYAMDFIIRGG